MFELSPFYLFRMSCMALTALTCTSCILLTALLASNIQPKSYVWVPTVIPGIVLLPAVYALLHPLLRPTQSQHVATELAWTVTAVPFLTSAAIFVSGISPVHANPETFILFHVLQILTWALFGIVTLYATTLTTLTLLTRLTIDPLVWTRDLAASPSPFPLAYILRRPTPAEYHNPNLWSSATSEDIRGYCMPGCACDRKCQSEVGAERCPRAEGGCEGRRASEVPIRVPSAIERVNSIQVGLRTYV